MFWKRKPNMQPIFMVVGLGNPGDQYRRTRHNVGFDTIDRLAQEHRIPVKKSEGRAVTGVGMIAGEPVLLVKPLTYMNLSGQAVRELSRRYRIPPDHILVIADDLDLEPGRIRMRAKGSAGGHNGHKSIIQCLATEEYPRIKLGIGKTSANTKDHVLSRFPPEERAQVDDMIAMAVRGVELWITEGIQNAMNGVNAGRV